MIPIFCILWNWNMLFPCFVAYLICTFMFTVVGRLSTVFPHLDFSPLTRSRRLRSQRCSWISLFLQLVWARWLLGSSALFACFSSLYHSITSWCNLICMRLSRQVPCVMSRRTIPVEKILIWLLLSICCPYSCTYVETSYLQELAGDIPGALAVFCIGYFKRIGETRWPTCSIRETNSHML